MVKTADELCGQSLNMPIKCPLHYSKSKGGFNDTTKARLQFTLTRQEKTFEMDNKLITQTMSYSIATIA